jgi:hypothetical protein
MSYNIFISHASLDTRIADEVHRIINNAFEGAIILYQANKELQGGDEWKSEIKNNLQRCNAIICIVTPGSVCKPWMFIEWSPFWIADKKYYLLLTDDVMVSDLVQVMQDRQTVNMMDTDSVKAFFRALARDADYGKVPFEMVEEFVDQIRLAKKIQSQEQSHVSYGKYRDGLIDLPKDDTTKRDIANYFYSNQEFNSFQRVVEQIKDDSIKAEMALQIVEKGELEHLPKIYNSIRSADRLCMIAIFLVDKGDLDSFQLREILESISTKNQAELRKVGAHLVDLGMEDSGVFHHISNELMTNMAELRKLAFYLVVNRRFEKIIFDEIMEKLSINTIELRKVTVEMIYNGYQSTSQFESAFDILCKKNRVEAEKALQELAKYDQDLFKRLSSKCMNQRTSSKKRS